MINQMNSSIETKSSTSQILISDTNIAEEATACGVRPDPKLEALVSELILIETGVMNGAEKEQVIIPARKNISQLFLFRQIYNIFSRAFIHDFSYNSNYFIFSVKHIVAVVHFLNLKQKQSQDLFSEKWKHNKLR